MANVPGRRTRNASATCRLVARSSAAPGGVRAGQVEEVAVEPVRPQPPQRLLARAHGARTAGVGGEHLGDDEDFVAPPFDDLGDHLLGAVQLGGVDVREAEIDPGPQRIHRFRAAQPPRALSNDGNTIGTELALQHAGELNPAPRARLAKAPPPAYPSRESCPFVAKSNCWISRRSLRPPNRSRTPVITNIAPMTTP